MLDGFQLDAIYMQRFDPLTLPNTFKIAILADAFLLDRSTGVDGTQVQLYNLALGFALLGGEIHYLSRMAETKETDVATENIHLHRLPRGVKAFSWLTDMWTIRHRLDDISPNVIYQRGRSHLTFIAAWWAARNKVPFIWGSNGEDGCDFWKCLRRLRLSRRPVIRKAILYPWFWLQDLLIHRGIRGATHVVNQTEQQRRRLWENFKKEGIILPSYYIQPEVSASPKKERVCVWLANLSPAKQPEIFLDLAAKCAGKMDWRFILAGGTADVTYLAQLRRLAEGLPNVSMTGAIPFVETGALLNSASIYVNTSRREADGVPNAMIQALFHGTAVLSLVHDPNSWLESYGLGICAHGDLAMFFSAADRLLADEGFRTDMGTQGRDFAERTFADARTIRKYLELFGIRSG